MKHLEYIIQCTIHYTVYNAPYSMQCTYVQYTLYSIQYAWYTLYYVVYTVHCTVHG